MNTPDILAAARRIMADKEHTVAGEITKAEGVSKASSFGVHIPQEIDVKAIRAKLGITQHEFAARFGFSIKTLRHWEQKQRVPEGPTRAYLLVIDRDPEAVQRALRSAT
ncbi:MAG: helix-turn-helix domain-containing protein [Methylocystis sp.]|jgi:putative transcriptional regulator|uniref:helix-turn-helix domain-containing protein n=1 Tax=Sphingomonas sp. TaxID=28214 RepID=UPI000A4175A4|nr:helix-turn-helix domain-containing protein [uncultured Hyphomicrobium sp.]